MRKSIQNKIILLILVGILFSSLTIGGLGIYSFRDELQKSVVSTMNLTCQEKAEELNNVLGRIEQSSEVMAVLAANHLISAERLQEDDYREAYIRHLCEAGYDIAINTKGSIGIYLRLNPEIAGPTEGFYWLIDETTGELELVENTDITAYSEDDVEHVGWYYQPVNAGQAIWMDPYENQNNGKRIVSYSMPIYKDNQLLGIAGMEIDWAYITDIVDETQLYKTGYAFLTDENFCVAYSREFENGVNVLRLNDKFTVTDEEKLVRSDSVYTVSIQGQNKVIAFKPLCNGKYMAVIAPEDEINAGFRALVWRIMVIVIMTSVAFAFITLQLAKGIIRPLKELDKAAQDIANGNLDVDITVSSDDEVGTLAATLSETAHQLKIKIDYINSLAYSDKLTGVKNNTAYLHDVALVKSDMQEGKADFSVFVIDANGLKYINDNYGHEVGNELIIKVTQMIADVFGHENLYRIGGDEFAVILKGATIEECEIYQKKFLEVVDKQKGKIWASASIGSATYNKKLDSTYESVFNRADEDMYENKVRMKAEGRTSRIV